MHNFLMIKFKPYEYCDQITRFIIFNLLVWGNSTDTVDSNICVTYKIHNFYIRYPYFQNRFYREY